MNSTSRGCSRAFAGTAHSPAPEQELEELAAIFEGQQHSVARREALPAQPACQPRDALGQLAVGS